MGEKGGYAAPELSMEPKDWWYPVVGRQDYRGYFREDLARREAESLSTEGFEVWVNEVDFYSTLGWFRDPVLNTFVKREEVDFAELIFHELAHRKYYLRGNTPFNEGMAEAVAREGVRRWFQSTGRPDWLDRYEARLGRIEQARVALGGASARLKQIYASDRDEAEMRTAKKQEYAKLQRRLKELRGEWRGGLTSWIDDSINNARLNSFTTYETEVPAFVALLQDCDGNFSLFWERVEELAKRVGKARDPE